MKKLTCIFAFLTAIVAILEPNSACASPWTLNENELSIALNFDFQVATHEHLITGEFQRFPLQGEFTGSTMRLGARYGFSERFEGELEINFKHVAFSADPVIFEVPETTDLRSLRESVFDFSQSEIGAADVFLGGRYNFFNSGSIVVTQEVRLKFPTGYESPRETFIGSDENPLNIADDVALGDGQTDLQSSLLFGAFIPATRSFFRAGAGFRFRFSEPGHQVIADAKLGQLLGSKFVAFVGTRFDYTVTEGQVIGQSFISNSPEDSGLNFDSDSVDAIDLTLDKDALAVEAGILFVAAAGVEIVGTYSYIPWGDNIPALHTVSAGVIARLPDLGGE